MKPTLTSRAVRALYPTLSLSKARLNPAKNQRTGSEMRRIASDLVGSVRCGFNRMAASAGDKVNDTKAEITVALAIVIANCL